MTREQKRWFLLILGGILIVLTPLALGQMFQTKRADAAWFNDNWGYRQTVNITNAGTNQTDFQVAITLDTATLITAGKMQSDCDDIRITDINGKILPYWIETGATGAGGFGCNGSATKIWTKAPTIPTSGATLYVYYGNPQVINGQNGTEVFEMFDDFSGSSLDTSKWTKVNGGTPTFSSGEMTVSASGESKILATGASTADNYIIRARFKTSTSADSDERVGLAVKASNASPPNGYNYVFHNFVAKNEFAMLNDAICWCQTNTYSWSFNTYYVLDVYHDGTNVKGRIDDGSWYSYATSGRTGYLGLNLGKNDAVSVYDFAFVRKGAATLPTVASPSSEEKAPSPVGYWKFDDGTGTTAQDTTTNNNDGTITGATWQTEDMCVSGKCLKFDGTDDYVVVTDNSSLDVTNRFTFSVWFKATAIPASDNTAKWFFGKDVVGGRSYDFGLWNTSGTVNLTVQINGTNRGLSSTAITADNKWHHAIVVYDGSNVTYYLDGRSDGSAASVDVAVTTTNLRIGGREYVGFTEPFNGFIDEPKIYNYARSADQIKADYANRGGLEGSSSVIASATNGARGNLSDGLVGYWKMDESSGNATDSSGNSNTGTNTNTVTYTAGKYANAGTYNGSTQYHAVTDAINLQMTSNFTVSAWVNPTTLNGQLVNYPIAKWANDSNGWAFGLNGTNSTGCTTSVGKIFVFASGTVVCGTSSLSTGTWYHIVFTNDGTTTKIYVNGVFEASGAQTIPTNSGTNLNMGRRSDGNWYYNGKVDEARVYNRALSPAEVSQLYNFAPGPVAYYNFEENTGSTVNDRSGNGNTGTWNGTLGSQWKSGKYGTSGNFNGSNNYLSMSDSVSLSPTTITINTWFKRITDSGGYEQLVSNWKDDSVNKRSYIMYIDTSDKVACDFSSDGAVGLGASTLSTNSTISLNTWYFATCTYDGTTARIYLNGIQEDTATSVSVSGSLYDSDAIKTLGASNKGTTDQYFTGLMDQVQIYNYARTQDQIISDMQGSSGTATFSLSSSGLTGGSNTKPAAPVGYWRFDEGYSTTANNVGNGGSSLNGTLTNMASPATSTSGWTQSGKVNKALIFDGSDDGVLIPASSAFNFSTNNFSYGAWANITSSSSFGRYIFAVSGGSGFSALSLVLNSNNTLTCTTTGSNTESATATSTNTISINTWYHYVCVRDVVAGKLYLYVNGVQWASGTATANTIDLTSKQIRIGSPSTGGVSTWNGSIDEPKIYNYALTADQVKLDMNQGSAQVLGTLSDNSSYQKSSANAEYCIPGDSTSCAAPVGRWDFDEATGTTANDSSGNANTGTLTNGPTWKAGKVNKSVNFDGSDDRVQVTSSSGDALDLTTNMTVSAWINPTAIHDTNNYIVSRRNSTNGDGYSMYLNNVDDKFRAIITTSAGNCGDANSTTTINTNTWYHVSFTYDGTNLRYYINGRPENVISCTQTSPSQSTNFLIGIYNDLAAQYAFNGKIDQVRIFNYARTPAQIAWDYNKGAPVGHWRMDECQGTTVNDASGNSNNGTITIGASGTQTSAGTCTDGASTSAWYNGRTGKRNYSLNFDGTDDYITAVSATTLGITPATKPFSIALWFKTTATTEVYLFDNYNGTPGDISLRLDTANGVIETLLWDTSGNQNGTRQYGTGYNNNNWHQLIFTWNGTGTEVVYVDGKQIGTTTSASVTGSLESGASFRIAARPNTTSYFPGQIDDVRIYNYALTATQVKNLFNGGTYRVGPVTGAP